jgi:hypothetical protein
MGQSLVFSQLCVKTMLHNDHQGLPISVTSKWFKGSKDMKEEIRVQNPSLSTIIKKIIYNYLS